MKEENGERATAAYTALLFSGQERRDGLRLVANVVTRQQQTDRRSDSQARTIRAAFLLGCEREGHVSRLELLPLGPSDRDLSSPTSTSFG